MNGKVKIVIALIVAMLINTTACSATKDNPKEQITEQTTRQSIELFQGLGELVVIEEYEGDDIYSIDAKQDIEKISEMIKENVVDFVKISSDDVVAPPPGDSNKAEHLMVIDSDGNGMRLYIDDKDLTYNLITDVVNGSDHSYCAYTTKKEIWQELKKIMHDGKKSSLNPTE